MSNSTENSPRIQYQLCNASWSNARSAEWIENKLDAILAREIWLAPRLKREPMTTREQVLAVLATGAQIQYGSDWYENLRDADAQVKAERPAPKMVRCDCGCECESILVMSASMGSSCPDCYDRMSN